MLPPGFTLDLSDHAAALAYLTPSARGPGAPRFARSAPGRRLPGRWSGSAMSYSRPILSEEIDLTPSSRYRKPWTRRDGRGALCRSIPAGIMQPKHHGTAPARQATNFRQESLHETRNTEVIRLMSCTEAYMMEQSGRSARDAAYHDQGLCRQTTTLISGLTTIALLTWPRNAP